MCQWCRNRDWDDTLSYETMKVVRVRDRWLGILRILMMAGIFGYIVGYVIIYQKKYMEVEVPIGAVAASLQKPADNTYVSDYPYCTQYNSTTQHLSTCSRQWPFRYHNCSSLRVYLILFVLFADPPPPPSIDQLPCQVWDEYQAVFPPDSLNSLFVTTRAQLSTQTASCANPLPPGGSCLFPYSNVGPSINYFMAGIENFTIVCV